MRKAPFIAAALIALPPALTLAFTPAARAQEGNSRPQLAVQPLTIPLPADKAYPGVMQLRVDPFLFYRRSKEVRRVPGQARDDRSGWSNARSPPQSRRRLQIRPFLHYPAVPALIRLFHLVDKAFAARLAGATAAAPARRPATSRSGAHGAELR